jgi:hypothetical protein
MSDVDDLYLARALEDFRPGDQPCTMHHWVDSTSGACFSAGCGWVEPGTDIDAAIRATWPKYQADRNHIYLTILRALFYERRRRG